MDPFNSIKGRRALGGHQCANTNQPGSTYGLASPPKPTPLLLRQPRFLLHPPSLYSLKRMTVPSSIEKNEKYAI